MEAVLPDGCEGDGNCHGCLCWCDRCGDVGQVCDVVERGGRCDAHQCWNCGKLGGSVWRACEPCEEAIAEQDAKDSTLRHHRQRADIDLGLWNGEGLETVHTMLHLIAAECAKPWPKHRCYFRLLDCKDYDNNLPVCTCGRWSWCEYAEQGVYFETWASALAEHELGEDGELRLEAL